MKSECFVAPGTQRELVASSRESPSHPGAVIFLADFSPGIGAKHASDALPNGASVPDREDRKVFIAARGAFARDNPFQRQHSHVPSCRSALRKAPSGLS